MPSSFDARINKYEPVDDTFSSKELGRSYWFVTHKVILRNLGIAVWIVADVMLIAYALFGFVQYLLTGQTHDQQMVLDIARRLQVPSANRIKSEAAAPLDFGDGRVYTFDAGNDRFDFAVEVQNPNKDWYALVTYQFDIAGGDATKTQTTFILPGEKKFLSVLGDRRSEQSVSDVALKITNTLWSRIDQHEIMDTQKFITDHAAFDVIDAKFTQAGLSSDNPIADNSGNSITFKITNKSAYNFWSLPLQIVLMRGGAVEGIEETQIKEFKTGETRPVDLRNYVKNQLVDEVIVTPSVDVFDPSVYMMQ